jgi:hypothetical protein
LGEQILQEELSKAEQGHSSENHRQRRQRQRSMKSRTRHYVRTPSESDSDDTDTEDDPVLNFPETIPSETSHADSSSRSVSPRPNDRRQQAKAVYRRKEDRETIQESKHSSSSIHAPETENAGPTASFPDAKRVDVSQKEVVSAPIAVPKAVIDAQQVSIPLPASSPSQDLSPMEWKVVGEGGGSLAVPVEKPRYAKKSLDDILAEEEGSKVGVGSEDTGDVEHSRSYMEESKVKVEEDGEHEFKAIQNTSQPLERIIAYCRKYIVSFLNANGGIMYFGVEDDGTVKGIPFSRRGRDLLRLGIDTTVSNIKPQVDTDLVSVKLIPVESSSHHNRKRQNAQAQAQSGKDEQISRYIVELHIGRGDAPVYLTHDGCAYFRRSGSVYRMDPELVQRRMENGRPKMAGGTLSGVPKEFIGREAELSQIKDYLLQNQNAKYVLVFLHGLPMTGKSTLARQLVDTWASMWPDGQFVADLKGFSSNYIHNIEAQVRIIRAVYPILQLPAAKSEVAGIYQSCFNQKRAILLLENVGKLAQIQELVLPASRSAKSVLVIVTSRRDLPIEVEMEGISIKLNALDENASVQLLRKIVASRGPKLTDETAKKLVKLCGYMPLPIRMLAANVARMPNESSVEALIQAVKCDDSKRIELLFGKLAGTFDLHLSPSSDLIQGDEADHSSQSTESTPDAADEDDPKPPQEFLLSLSIFPSSFDLQAASYLWGLGSRETGAILQSLVDSNEIDLSQDKLRYSQNDLFRAWCQKKALEVFEEAGILKWKGLFIDYYLTVMAKCSDFYEKHQVNQGLELLILESANFERTIAYSLQIGEAKSDYVYCAKVVLAIERLNVWFGSGEQRKWAKLKDQLTGKPKMNELIAAITRGEMPSHPTDSPVQPRADTGPALASAVPETSSSVPSTPATDAPVTPTVPIINTPASQGPTSTPVPVAPSAEHAIPASVKASEPCPPEAPAPTSATATADAVTATAGTAPTPIPTPIASGSITSDAPIPSPTSVPSAVTENPTPVPKAT